MFSMMLNIFSKDKSFMSFYVNGSTLKLSVSIGSNVLWINSWVDFTSIIALALSGLFSKKLRSVWGLWSNLGILVVPMSIILVYSLRRIACLVLNVSCSVIISPIPRKESWRLLRFSCLSSCEVKWFKTIFSSLRLSCKFSITLLYASTFDSRNLIFASYSTFLFSNYFSWTSSF